jgi:hypothetical protein
LFALTHGGPRWRDEKSTNKSYILRHSLGTVEMTKPSVKVLKQLDRNISKPARTLGKAGASLWSRIVEEFDISDSAGKELLLLACECTDRAEALRSQIDKEGEIVKAKDGTMRDHPGLKHELQNRSFVSKVLQRLDLETMKRPIGRPPRGGLGITDAYRKTMSQAETRFSRTNGNDA